MRRELFSLSSFFSELDSDVRKIASRTHNALGISENHLTAALDDILSGKPDEAPIDQRVPKKQERVLKAWSVPTEDASSLIFQTDVGVSESRTGSYIAILAACGRDA